MRNAVLLIAILFMTTACADIYSPPWMPSGYAYHQDIYKSPPGTPAYDIGYDYSPYTNEKVLTEWSAAADDFVRKIESSGALDISRDPLVYLEPGQAPSTLQQTFDFVLRDVLRERGYTLATTGDQYRIRLVYQTALQNKNILTRGALPYGMYEMDTFVYEDDPSPHVTHGVYHLPAFDYKEDFAVEDDSSTVNRTRNF
jgi:hypothetical protein